MGEGRELEHLKMDDFFIAAMRDITQEQIMRGYIRDKSVFMNFLKKFAAGNRFYVLKNENFTGHLNDFFTCEYISDNIISCIDKNVTKSGKGGGKLNKKSKKHKSKRKSKRRRRKSKKRKSRTRRRSR